MAIARGAGTEIIRSASFFDTSAGTNTILIMGVQHHIYTVLSVIWHALSVNSVDNEIELKLTGWDADNAASGIMHKLIYHKMNTGDTFVWNDKFSFSGYEPTGVSSQLSTATEQDALADQGGSTAQYLWSDTESGSDSVNVFVTYIDQNNA